MVRIFVDPNTSEKLLVHTMKRVKAMVVESVFVQDQTNLEYLEKFIIALLGHEQEWIRNCAIQYLNLIYDQ